MQAQTLPNQRASRAFARHTYVVPFTSGLHYRSKPRTAIATRAQSSPESTSRLNLQLPAAVLGVWKKHTRATVDDAGVKAELKGLHWAAVAAPFASMAVAPNPNQELFVILAKLLDMYIIVLTVRIVLSWFRQVDWYSEPWTYLREITDPFLNLFRGLLPSLGKIDISPIVGFIILQYVQKLVAGLAGL